MLYDVTTLHFREGGIGHAVAMGMMVGALLGVTTACL